MILDTSFLVELLRGRDERIRKKVEELDKKFENKSISSITVMELWRGAILSTNDEKEKKKINDLLQSLLVYSFNEKEAKKAGEIEAELIKKGEKIDIENIMTASAAIMNNEKMLTLNTRHFSKIKRLNLELF